MMTNVAFMGKTCAGKNPFRRLAALGMCLFVSMLTFAAEREKVVFVVAHPDDLAQPSGTALLLSQKYDVKVVDYTRGENGIDEKGYRDGSTGRLRVAEERAACKFLNTEQIFLSCVNYRGQDLAAYEKATRELVSLFEQWKPRAVFLHWPLDINPDHMMSSASAMHALYLSNQSPEIYFFEQTNQTRSFRPTHYVNVESVCETKKRLMACYVCQNAPDIIARKTADDIFRGRRIGLWMAEAFAVYEGSIKNGCGVLDDLPSRR